jgi:hypothetical protein
VTTLCQQGHNQRNKARSDQGFLARAARRAASTDNPTHKRDALRLKEQVEEAKRVFHLHVAECGTCTDDFI